MVCGTLQSDPILELALMLVRSYASSHGQRVEATQARPLQRDPSRDDQTFVNQPHG